MENLSALGFFIHHEILNKKQVISHFVDFIGLLRLLQALFLIAAVHLEWQSARHKMAGVSCSWRCNTFFPPSTQDKRLLSRFHQKDEKTLWAMLFSPKSQLHFSCKFQHDQDFLLEPKGCLVRSLLPRNEEALNLAKDVGIGPQRWLFETFKKRRWGGKPNWAGILATKLLLLRSILCR